MDRFHAVPRKGTGSESFFDSWAEWLYFNGRTADGSVRFYLTFLAGPPGADGQRTAAVRLQLDRGGRSTNYSAAARVDGTALLAHAPDLAIAGNHVRLEGTQYQLTLSLTRERSTDSRTPNPESRIPNSDSRTPNPESRIPNSDSRTPNPESRIPNSESRTPNPESHLEGELVLDAPASRSLPPVVIHGARGWLSGYVVPVLSGPVRGSLRIGGETIALDEATGYHDHNWGFWEGVRWQWGQVAGDGVSIVFGRVFPPEAIADSDHVPGFLGVLGPAGPLGFSTDVAIAEQGDSGAPTGMTIHARGPRIDLRLSLAVDESVTTRMPLTQLPGGAAMNFLQLGGTFRVDGRAADRALKFTARGAAETFRATR
jgi:hypothetical protein